MVAAAAGTVTSAMVVAEDWPTTVSVTVVAAVAATGGAMTARTGLGVTRWHRAGGTRGPTGVEAPAASAAVTDGLAPAAHTLRFTVPAAEQAEPDERAAG